MGKTTDPLGDAFTVLSNIVITDPSARSDTEDAQFRINLALEYLTLAGVGEHRPDLCTCTLACIPQGMVEGQTCRMQLAREQDAEPGLPPTTGEGNTGLDDVLVRVERAYLNEIAEKRQAQPTYSAEEIERVGRWLAGVSFNEWFALVAECGRLREQLDAARQALEVYADARNWGIMRDEFRHPSCVWIGPGATDTVPDAPGAARAALGVEGPAG